MALSLTIDQLINKIPVLTAGTDLLLSGTMYTARDAAHKRFAAAIAANEQLPIDLSGAVIYYCGPAPARPGDALGPCGPTTAARMDPYTPLMLSRGVRVTIGKGRRSATVRDAVKAYQALYCVATGGVAALLARTVRSAAVAAYHDLGPEAVWRLAVVDFPATIALDAHGNDIFDQATNS